MKKKNKDFPDGTDKNPPTRARSWGLIPGAGRFHTSRSDWACEPKALNPFTETTEGRAPGACASQQEKPSVRSHALQLESNPHSAQLEKAHAQQRRPSVFQFQLTEKQSWRLTFPDFKLYYHDTKLQ